MNSIRKKQKNSFNAFLIILGFFFFVLGLIIFQNLDIFSKSTTNLMFEPKNKYINPNLKEKWLNYDFNLNIEYRKELQKSSLTLDFLIISLIVLGAFLIILGVIRICLEDYNQSSTT